MLSTKKYEIVVRAVGMSKRVLMQLPHKWWPERWRDFKPICWLDGRVIGYQDGKRVFLGTVGDVPCLLIAEAWYMKPDDDFCIELRTVDGTVRVPFAVLD